HKRSEADLARLVARRWSDGERYGKVQVDKPCTEATVLTSPSVATPLRRLMMSRPTDGAVAVLLASADIARRIARAPVWITGLGTSMDRHSFAARRAGALDACEKAGRMAYSRAGWTKPTPSIAEVSGSSAVGEAMVLESLRLVPPGGGL